MLGKEVKLPTVSLQIDYTTNPLPAETLLCCSAFASRNSDLVTAESYLMTEDGENVGRARARFLLTTRQTEQGFTRFPWEIDQDAIPCLSELSAIERQIHSFLLTKDPNTRQRRLYDQLYQVTGTPSDRPGTARLRQPLGPHLANRSGVVQGGVIAGLLSDACQAAARSRDASLRRVLSSSCTFLRPASLDREFLFASATVLFIGRRIACVSAEATDDRNTIVARAEALFSV
jgi:acyl-coenzyme A thioesterase PaaI-like protein